MIHAQDFVWSTRPARVLYMGAIRGEKSLRMKIGQKVLDEAIQVQYKQGNGREESLN